MKTELIRCLLNSCSHVFLDSEVELNLSKSNTMVRSCPKCGTFKVSNLNKWGNNTLFQELMNPEDIEPSKLYNGKKLQELLDAKERALRI